MPQLRAPDGSIVSVSDDEASQLTAGGYQPVTPGEAGSVTAAAEKPSSGVLAPIGAAASSFLSGATLGGSDWAFKGLLEPEDFERLAADREAHPITSGAGQLAGAVIGGPTPAGYLNRTAAGLAEGGGIGAKLAASAIEGAGQNAGAYLADTALGDRKLSAEGLVGALGTGMEFGVGAGVVALGVEKGTIAARRLFARATGSAKGAAAAEQEWATKYQTTIEAHDAAADVARAKLAEASLARQQAQLGQQRAAADLAEARIPRPAPEPAVGEPPPGIAEPPAPGMPEAASGVPAAAPGAPRAPAPPPEPPAVEAARLLHDRAMLIEETEVKAWDAANGGRLQELLGPQAALLRPAETAAGRSAALSEAAEKELSEALAGHDGARAELDDLLAKIEAPGLQAPAVVRQPVPVGEFGAPGARGFKSQDELAKLAEGSAGDSLAPSLEPGTAAGGPRALRGGAGGTPVEPAAATARPAAREIATDEEFRAMQQDLRSKLTPDEIKQSIRFSREYYIDINRHLRGNPKYATLAESEAKIIPAMDSILEKSTTPETLVTHRGASINRAGKLQPGDVFEDPAYQSTSYRSEKIRRFGEVHVVVTSPAGTKIAAIPSSASEGEFLLPRNTKLRIDARDVNDKGEITLHATVLDQSAPTSATKAAAAPATDSLTGLLRGTQEKLGAGESLVEMGAPARAGYLAAKETRTAESAQRFRGKAIEAHEVPEYSAIKAHEAKADAALEQTLPARKIAARGYHEPPIRSGSPGMALEEADPVRMANARKAIAEGQREAIDLTVSASGKIGVTGGRHRLQAAIEADAPIKVKWSTGTEPIESDVLRGGAKSPATSEHPLSVQRLEAAHEAALEREASAVTPGERAAATREAQAIERQLTAVGARPGAVEDVAAVAEVVTKYEKASARLTEALGADAPPAAQEAAKAVRAAEAEVERKSVARTTRAVEAHVADSRPTTSAADWNDQRMKQGLGDALAAPPKSITAGATPEVANAKVAKLRADADSARARAAETEAKIGSGAAKRQAAETRAAADAARPAAAAGAGETSKLGSIATVLGVAAEVGIPGLPHPKDIPLIGPLLSMYLKYRAVKATAGRFVGRVPATGDARAAALVAKTKDRIAVAVDRTLGLAAEVAPKARGPLVATAVVLGRRVFDDGQPDAPKGASEAALAAVRIREISTAATRPDLVEAMVRRRLGGVTDPDLIDAAVATLQGQFKYLASTMPKAPPANPYTKTQWVPSAGDTANLARRIAVAHDPEAALSNPTPAGADAFNNFYPRLAAFAQQRLAERAADLKNPVEYHQLVRASIVFQIPMHVSLQPDNAVLLRAAFSGTPSGPSAGPAPAPGGPPGAPPLPSIAGPTNLNQLYTTSADRRAQR